MKKTLPILIICVCLFACTKQESRFVPTQVTVKTNDELSIDKVFEFINSHNHRVECVKYGKYNSSLPADSLQYVLDYLNDKPYTQSRDSKVTGYLHYDTNLITIFPKLYKIKKKKHQEDWLQAMEILQLTGVGGNTIYFNVLPGMEEAWVDRFETYDFVEWAALNYY